MLIEMNRERRERLSKTEYEIVRFINENADRLSEFSIVDIAFETYSSPSTVSRAIRKCEINGFNELRTRAIDYMSKERAYTQVNNMVDIMNKSLDEIKGSIEQLSSTDILKIIDLIHGSRRIFVLARGLTEYVSEEFALKLQLLDYNVMFIGDPNIMREKTKRLSPQDLVIIFSLNGLTKELLESAENTVERNAGLVSCSCSANTPLNELATVALVGVKHRHIAITDYEVSSRLPLQMISRIITDYLVLYDSKKAE